MRWLRQAGVGLLLGGAAWGVWYVLAGPGAATATGPDAPSVGSPAVESEGNSFTLWGERNGRAVRECKVTARRFYQSADRRFRELDGVTDAVFFEEGRVVARATAGHARQDIVKNELDVKNGMRVRLGDGRAAIASATAHWRGAPRRLVFPESLLLTAPNARFRAARGEADFRGRHARLFGLDGMTGGARVTSPRCRYDISSRTLRLEPLTYRAPGVELRLARARLDTRTNEFAGEQVTMKATVTDLQRTFPGGRLLASAALAALAAGSPAAPGSDGSAAKKDEPKSSTLEIVRCGGASGQDKKHLVLVKGVLLRHKDTDFACDRIEIFYRDDEPSWAVATGSPRATDPRNTVTGDKFTIYFKERRLLVEGSVKAVTRPKDPPPDKPATAAGEKSLREKLKGDTVITANRLEYDYRRKNLVAEGNLKFVNAGRTLTAQRLTYADKTDDLVLTAPVQFRNEKGEEFNFPDGSLKMNLKEGSETLDRDGLFTGKLLIKETEDEAGEDAPAAGATGTGKTEKGG